MENNSYGRGPSLIAGRVAMVRAFESLKPEDERICYDPYAARFIGLGPGNAKAIGERMESLFPGLVGSLVARTRYFDDVVRASTEDGLEQLVILGAGYDSRAYRIEGLEKVRVFEVDHPGTSGVKRDQVKRIFGTLPGHVTYVPVDLEVDGLGRRLDEGGYDRTKKTLFVLEGLVMYIPPEAVDDLLYFIAHGSGEGSAMVFDCSLRSGSRGAHPTGIKLASYTKKGGEPIKFHMPGSAEEFLAKRGFSRVRVVTPEDYKRMYFHGKNEGRTVYSLSFIHAAIE